ncbi:T9SS type A sorting domain-containing protein [Flavobacterium agri]|uniref:T9SS type A sorting domain-containing protein n=1 Tax=Flavobacterium agri TaxID=2743471 RepID=UPI003F9EF16E
MRLHQGHLRGCRRHAVRDRILQGQEDNTRRRRDHALAGGENQGYVDGPGSSAQFFGLMGICVDAAGTIYVADSSNNRIRKITPAGVVSTLVDGTSLFISIHDLCINNATGMLFVTDRYAHKIYKVTPTGAISTFAGSGVMGYQEGTGTNAKFSFPYCLCIDASGNLYVTDNTYLIRKITPAGVVTTLAGGPGGDQDGIGTAARFGNLEGICVNTQGTQYVVDIQHRKIRKISNSLGVDDAARLDGMRLYPNPVKGILNVELEGFGGGLVSVVDLSGKVVYSGAAQNPVTTIDTSTLAKGVYFVKVTEGGEMEMGKFVVE